MSEAAAPNPGVQRARSNIGELKIAMRKERGVLEDYRDRLRTGRGGFPASGLEHGIERCEHNLQVLKDAILGEKANIRAMDGQQKINDEMARIRAGFEIPVEYVNEGEDEGLSGGGDADGDDGETMH